MKPATRTVRVRFEKGVLKPLDPVELAEGEELEVIIVQRSFKGFSKEAGKYKFIVDRDIVEEFSNERR